MNKAFKYRLYPTTEQTNKFINTFGCCRKVYNLMLADKITHYEATGKMLATTPAMYKKEYPFLKEADSLALANEQLHLQTAYRNFFRDKKVGFPKFKSAKHSRKSYTTNNQNGTVAIVERRYLKLPKIGLVKAKIHRQPDVSWKIKSATVSQDSDGKFYASVLFEYDKTVACVPVSDNAVGLDYASDGLYVDDMGNAGTCHKYYRESQKKLAKAQRKLSRMIEHNISGYRVIGNKRYPVYERPLEDCKNIQKQKAIVNKILKHTANQRRDFLHKESTKIANLYDVVCVETLDMRAIANKGFGNGKATLDNGYGMFLAMLEYKLADRGKHFVKIDKWYPSSQICHCCGEVHKEMKNLKERIMRCSCGLVMNRDHNSAINIKKEGLRILKTA